MSKSQSQMTKAELVAALDKANQKVEAQAAENQKLRQALERRPADALIIGTNLTFQKGTHQDLVGTSLGGVKIPSEAITLYFSSKHVCKRNSNGNVQHYATGWCDTSKLKLPAPGEKQESAEDKSKKSFEDQVLND